MTHIVIQEELNGKAVEWMERVTDEQYPQVIAEFTLNAQEVKMKLMAVSSLFRNVPLFTSLEGSLFLLCCCHWGHRRSEALRRGLIVGAFPCSRSLSVGCRL
jgi:hypothetical protein